MNDSSKEKVARRCLFHKPSAPRAVLKCATQCPAHHGREVELWCPQDTHSYTHYLFSLSSAFILVTGSGFFMHFDSSSINVGATAVLESRNLYPKRGFQCLQFYLHNSGSENDQMNIFIREYSAGNENGTLTLAEEIKGTVLTFSLLGFRVRQS